jgi:hypothetical protein
VDRLLEELGDILYVYGGDTTIRLRLYSRCVFRWRMQTEVELLLFLYLSDVSLDTYIAAAVVVYNGNDRGRCDRRGGLDRKYRGSRSGCTDTF